MYKGIKITPANLPNCLRDDVVKNYDIEVLQNTIRFDGAHFSVLKVVPNIPSELNQIMAGDFPLESNFEYHNCSVVDPIDVAVSSNRDKRYPTYSFRDNFNYRPENYIKYIETLNEVDMINYYLSVESDQNDKYINSFALSSDLTSTEVFENINTYRASLRQRTQDQINQAKNLLLTSDAEHGSVIDRYKFPFGVEINFEFSDTNKVTQILDKYKLHASMINYVTQANTFEINMGIQSKNFETSGPPVISPIRTKSFNQFLAKTYYKKYDNFTTIPDRMDGSMFSYNINKLKSKPELAGEVLKFSDLRENYVTTSELLYLKIDKYAGKNASGEPIQTIYLSGNSEKYFYFDSQVKNKKLYTYKVTGIFLLSGTQFRFTNIDLQQGLIGCRSISSRRIIEREFIRKQVYVLQPLPLPPKVNVYKHKDKNEVYFHLRLSRENSRYEPYKTLAENDYIFSDIINSTRQYEDPEHGYVNEPAIFEVFKTTTRPYKLSDLQDSFLLETKVIRDRRDHLFIDRIEYEKDYYYLFRTKNGENFPGNPTSLYKIRLLKGIEENILRVEILDFVAKPSEYEVKKDFNQLMHIYPNDSQLVMRNIADIGGDTYQGRLNEVQVGSENVPNIWGKKFKLRVTSNNTGKKIDLNVKFSIKRKELGTE